MKATTNRLIPTEAESKIANTSANLATGACALDLASGIDEVNSKVVMLDKSSTDSENVWVEDDVLGYMAYAL